MAEHDDPSLAFFPDSDGEPDLYGCLGVEEKATVEEIRKAYRKLALQHHPDKGGDAQRFQQIGFAYAVLSDAKRRKRFDDTGKTDESFFEGEADWNAYFKELWQGEVNKQTLDDFVKGYKGSDEERADILAAYTDSEGSLDALFENVMASNVLDDEDRFISIVDSAIKAKEVKSYPKWKKDIKDSKGREKRRQAAKGEAAEAEELAKELGVHDKIFGNGGGDDAGKKGAKGKKKAGKVNDDGVDEDALRELIQSRHSKNNTMNSLIEKLESKYGAAEGDPLAGGSKSSKGKGKKRASNADEESEASQKKGKKGSKAGPNEPTEEEFEALQKKLFGGKDSGKKDAQAGGDGADELAAKRSKRSKKA